MFSDENIARFAIFICTFEHRTHVVRKGVIKNILQRYLTVIHFHKITGVLIPKLMIWRMYKWHIFDVPKNNLRGTYRTVRACACRLNTVTPEVVSLPLESILSKISRYDADLSDSVVSFISSSPGYIKWT